MAASDDNSIDEELFSFDVVVKYPDKTPAIGAVVRVHEKWFQNMVGDEVTVYVDPEGKLPYPNHLSPDPELGLVQGYLPRGDYLLVISPKPGLSRRTIMPLKVPERSMETL